MVSWYLFEFPQTETLLNDTIRIVWKIIQNLLFRNNVHWSSMVYFYNIITYVAISKELISIFLLTYSFYLYMYTSWTYQEHIQYLCQREKQNSARNVIMRYGKMERFSEILGETGAIVNTYSARLITKPIIHLECSTLFYFIAWTSSFQKTLTLSKISCNWINQKMPNYDFQKISRQKGTCISIY